MAVQMFVRFGSFVALALGVGLEEVEVVLPEPTVGSEVEVRRAVWGKLVAEGASCLGTDYRKKQAWIERLGCIAVVLVGKVVPKVLTKQCVSDPGQRDCL